MSTFEPVPACDRGIPPGRVSGGQRPDRHFWRHLRCAEGRLWVGLGLSAMSAQYPVCWKADIGGRFRRTRPRLLPLPHSGSGVNSASPGTGSKRPDFQSALAASMRSRREETKFHQMWRGPSIAAPPRIASRVGVAAVTVMRSPGRNTSSRPVAKRSPTCRSRRRRHRLRAPRRPHRAAGLPLLRASRRRRSWV